MIESSVYDPLPGLRYAAIAQWYTVTETETLGMQR
jgi:hypothetical protein